MKRAELLKDNQVLSHSSLQSTALKQSKDNENLYKLLPTLAGVSVGAVKPVTGCVRQFPGKALLLTNSPGEETVYKLKLIQGSALLPLQPQETSIPAPLVSHSFWELHLEEQERVLSR